jgi:hypothetical protein
MRLISPTGVRFSCSDEKGERYLAIKGYKRLDGAAVEAAPPADAPVKAADSAPKRRTRSPKAKTPDTE